MAGRSGLRRVGLGVVDQGLYSVTNFALTVLVARSAGVDGFGVFAVISSTYVIVIAIVRGFAAETFNVRYAKTGTGRRERARWRFAASGASGFSAAAGLLCGLVLVLVGAVLLSGSTAATVIVFGVTLPGLLVQDFYRFAALAQGTPANALLTDVATAVVQFGVSGALIATGHDSVTTLVAAWGGAAYVGLVVGAVRLNFVPHPERLGWWLRTERSMALSLAADDAASQSNQVSGYVVAVVGGLSDIGALRGAQAIFGPPSIANMSVMVAVTPELVRVLHRAPRRLRTLAGYVSLSQVAIAAVWAVAALVLPDSVGRALFGATWDNAQSLLWLLAIAQIGIAARVGAMSGLRALGQGRQVLRARGVVTAIMWIATIGAAAIGGATGVAVALAIVNPVQAAVWWYFFRTTLRRHLAERRAEAAAQADGETDAQTDAGTVPAGGVSAAKGSRPAVPHVRSKLLPPDARVRPVPGASFLVSGAFLEADVGDPSFTLSGSVEPGSVEPGRADRELRRTPSA